MTQELAVLSTEELRALITKAVREAYPAPPELLSTEELAEALKVSPDAIRHWVKHKGCPHFRLGDKMLRFRLEAVMRWSER